VQLVEEVQFQQFGEHFWQIFEVEFKKNPG
jgi:hypothetical protein